MKQEGLIDGIIKALRLDVGTVNGKSTPAEAKSGESYRWRSCTW